MSEKKGFWANLFSGGCSCGMSVEEEKADDQKPAKKRQMLRYGDHREKQLLRRRYRQEIGNFFQLLA